MNSTVYSRIGRVYFQKDNEGSNFNYVYEFEDDNDKELVRNNNCSTTPYKHVYYDIVIKSPAQIDFVYRGWLGDITYWAADGMDMNNPENTNLTSESCCVRDVLCVRVNVTYDSYASVMWKYVFLKY